MTEVITYSRREAELLVAARAAIAGQPEATERLRLAVEAYPSQPANYDPKWAKERGWKPPSERKP